MMSNIYLLTIGALVGIYLPIFLLAIFNHSIKRISRWILIIPSVSFLLLLPTHPSIRRIPLINMFIAGIAGYNVQKICEWIIVRREEFHQWSFMDIHHELCFYRIYTHPISLRKFDERKKVVFYNGPIQYHKHLQSLIFLLSRIIRYYLLFDLFFYLLGQIFTTDLYERYFLIRIVINLSNGWLVYFFLQIIYEHGRFQLCFLLNRPLEFIPDLFQEPYRARSPSDFWTRWHQGFKPTWTELVFKPTCRFLQRHYPDLSNSIKSGIAIMCVFLFSGLMHEYTAYIVLEQASGDQVKFFILQGLAVLIEQIFHRRFPRLILPRSLCFLFMFFFNGITAGYFLRPWIVHFQTYPTLKYSWVDFLRKRLWNCFS